MAEGGHHLRKAPKPHPQFEDKSMMLFPGLINMEQGTVCGHVYWSLAMN